MGTRSRIAVRNADGTYDSIYCHWDGYPSHNGVILKEAYATEERARALIALGDLSSLGRDLGEKHDFGTALQGVCTAYGRDRGESGVDATKSAGIDELCALTQQCGGEWLYVFEPEHGWMAAQGGMSMFGMPATKAPGGLQPIDFWLEQEEA